MPELQRRNRGPGTVEEAVLAALARLDRRLQVAEVRARTLYGSQSDAFRGLHISAEDVERSLARPPGAALFGAEHVEIPGDDLSAAAGPRFADFVRSVGLASFDLDVLILAVAPEIDLRYERIYAFLQDDITRRRPTVDLALHLLCDDSGHRLARRRHFAADAPLFRHGLLRLESDVASASPPLLAHALIPDSLLVSFLLGEQTLDRRLIGVATLHQPSLDDGPPPKPLAGLEDVVTQAAAGGSPFRLLLEGADASERLRVVRWLVHAAGLPLLSIDLTHPSATSLLRLAARQARLEGWALFVDGEPAESGEPWRHAIGELAAVPPPVFLVGADRMPGGELGLARVRLGPPDADERRALWRTYLADASLPHDPSTVDALAARFTLSAAQIASAAAAASMAARWRDDVDLHAFARAECGHQLARLAFKVDARHGWDDLVLSDDARAQLREICQRVRLREAVLGEWGFGAKLSSGKGTSVLFSGASGTGKTMAAEVVAGELGFDLYKIDLATVASKYIGETEKNLERIFAAAEAQNAILFFDEADAIFGKRSAVNDAHDRYANLEVSFLLQKMEAYEGVVILATNLRQNIDEAFLRRFAFVVPFAFPDAPSRRRIWARSFPASVPLANDVPLDRLAERLALSGGNIRNIALAAAFLARDAGGAVSAAHLVQAICREYQKLGRRLTAEEQSALHP